MFHNSDKYIEKRLHKQQFFEMKTNTTRIFLYIFFLNLELLSNLDNIRSKTEAVTTSLLLQKVKKRTYFQHVL